MDVYNKSAKEYAKIRASQANTEVKTKHGPLAKKLLYWYFDGSLSKKAYREIQNKALKVLSKDKIILVGEFLVNEEIDKKRYEWEFHGYNFQAMIKNCRPLIQALDFQVMPHNKPILVGIQFMQSIFRSGQSLKDIHINDFLLDTIPSHLKQYLLEKNTTSRKKIKPPVSVHPYRYEFYLYDYLHKQLKNNKIYTNDSTQYKNFANDIQLKKTAREKRQLLNSLDAPRLNQTAEVLLDDLKNELENLIKTVNNRIKSGNNSDIKIKLIKGKSTWTLPYKKKTDEYNFMIR